MDLRKDINSNIWSENATGTIVHKQQEVADKSSDGATTSDVVLGEDKKVTSPVTLTKQDQAKVTLSGATSRKAFTVQDKVCFCFYLSIWLDEYWIQPNKELNLCWFLFE